MTGNAPKEIGNSCKCFKCGNPIFCRGKEYQGKTSPQWQNNDGKSHYDKDGGCKVVNNTTATTSSTTYTSNIQVVDLSGFKPEVVTPAQEALFVDLVVKAAEYTLIAQRELQKYKEISNPALKGLVTKLAMKMMEQQGKSDD